MKKTEKEFLASYNIHDFEVPLVSVDVAVFTLVDNQLQILLVRRGEFPQKGKWGLPGGFIDLHRDASLEATAIRKLQEKTGVKTPYVEQIASVGSPDRDPRGWSVTVLYMALIPRTPAQSLVDSVDDARWWPYADALVQPLAFDHQSLIELARSRLRSKTAYTTLPIYLLTPPFTLTDLQSAFELLADTPLDKKAFRRRLEAAQVLEEVPGMSNSGRGRPAALFKPIKGFGGHVFRRVFGDVNEQE